MNKNEELDEYAAVIIQISEQIKARRTLLKKLGKPHFHEVRFKSKPIYQFEVILGILFFLTLLVTVAAYSEPTYASGSIGTLAVLYVIYFIIVQFILSEIRFIKLENAYLGLIYVAPLIACGNYLKLGQFWDWQSFFLFVLPPLLLSIGALINSDQMDKAFVKNATPDVLIQSLSNNGCRADEIDKILYMVEELLYLDLIYLDDIRIPQYIKENKRVLLILISLAISESDRFLDYIISGGNPETLKELKDGGYSEAIFRNKNAEDNGSFKRFNRAIEKL